MIMAFLGLVKRENGTADAIVNGLKTLFAEFKLNIKNLIGIGTDNASSMTGVNNGVHSLLKIETGSENLVLVRCLCHSLQLAVTHASEESCSRINTPWATTGERCAVPGGEKQRSRHAP